MTTPETMVERVARAICENRSEREGFWKSVPESRRKGYRTQARAAIREMMEPTPLMLQWAGGIENYDYESMSAKPDADHVEWWQAMLTAALEEGEG